jgi:hypothetical protein
VTWSAPSGGTSPTDWLGLYRVGDPPNAYRTYRYTGGTLTGTWTVLAPPFPGTYEVRYLVRNTLTSVATSAPVTVGVSAADTLPPTVSLTSPLGGSLVSGRVLVSASASDEVGVVGVQLLLDGAPLGSEVLTRPYSGSWEATTATVGEHVLTARARDAAGHQTTSLPVRVTVSPAGSGYALTVTPQTVAPSRPLTVTWTAPSGGTSPIDWLGLYRVGAPAGIYLAFQYTGGGLTGTKTFLAPAAPGTYEVRYLRNNGYTSVATSAAVTVQ